MSPKKTPDPKEEPLNSVQIGALVRAAGEEDRLKAALEKNKKATIAIDPKFIPGLETAGITRASLVKITVKNVSLVVPSRSSGELRIAVDPLLTLLKGSRTSGLNAGQINLLVAVVGGEVELKKLLEGNAGATVVIPPDRYGQLRDNGITKQGIAKIKVKHHLLVCNPRDNTKMEIFAAQLLTLFEQIKAQREQPYGYLGGGGQRGDDEDRAR